MVRDPEKRKASQAAYYAAHRDKCVARSKRYKAAHPEELRRRAAAYRASHKDEIASRKAEYNRAYYARRRDELKAATKAYRLAHVEERRERDRLYYASIAEPRSESLREQWRRSSQTYRAAHPHRRRQIDNKRRAAKRAVGAETVDYDLILAKSAGLCGICQEPLGSLAIEFDHIIPLARGGTHTTANIQTSHTRCNRAKGARVA